MASVGMYAGLCCWLRSIGPLQGEMLCTVRLQDRFYDKIGDAETNLAKYHRLLSWRGVALGRGVIHVNLSIRHTGKTLDAWSGNPRIDLEHAMSVLGEVKSESWQLGLTSLW